MTKIQWLCAMRIGESKRGFFSKRGRAEVKYAINMLGGWVNGKEVRSDSVVVLCSGEEHMRAAAEIARQMIGLGEDRVVISDNWPKDGEAKGGPEELTMIHKAVMANEHDIVIVILPEALAGRYALHFMLTEKVGRPDPGIVMVLEPGEATIVNCKSGMRNHIAMPGNSALEQMLGTDNRTNVGL